MKENGIYLVSIIMPTYNRAGLIMEAVQSVMAQSYTNWELIIVDDGSEDDTEQKVASLREERIIFIKAGRIGRNGRVKNIALSKCRGPLIAFIDSDDLWAPGKLEKQVEALAQYPAAGFSLTGGYNFKEYGMPTGYFYKKRDGIRYGNMFQAIFRSEVASLTPTLLFRRTCLEKTGYFNEQKPFSDGDFILGLARYFDGVVLYEPLFFRRLHHMNDSDVNWIARYEEGLERIQVYKKNKELPARLACDAMFRLNINFGEKYLRYQEYGKAIKKFFNAWLYKPLSIVPLKKTAKAVLFSLKK